MSTDQKTVADRQDEYSGMGLVWLAFILILMGIAVADPTGSVKTMAEAKLVAFPVILD